MRTVFINLDARKFVAESWRYVIAFVIRAEKWKNTRESVFRRFSSRCLVCSGGHLSKLTFASNRSGKCHRSIPTSRESYYWFIDSLSLVDTKKREGRRLSTIRNHCHSWELVYTVMYTHSSRHILSSIIIAHKLRIPFSQFDSRPESRRRLVLERVNK